MEISPKCIRTRALIFSLPYLDLLMNMYLVKNTCLMTESMRDSKFQGTQDKQLSEDFLSASSLSASVT